MPRTNIYHVFRGLTVKGLVHRVAGSGPAVWTAPVRDERIERLETLRIEAHEEQMQHHRLRAIRAREMWANTFLLTTSRRRCWLIHLIHGPVQAKKAYEQVRAFARLGRRDAIDGVVASLQRDDATNPAGVSS